MLAGLTLYCLPIYPCSRVLITIKNFTSSNSLVNISARVKTILEFLRDVVGQNVGPLRPIICHDIVRYCSY